MHLYPPALHSRWVQTQNTRCPQTLSDSKQSEENSDAFLLLEPPRRVCVRGLYVHLVGVVDQGIVLRSSRGDSFFIFQILTALLPRTTVLGVAPLQNRHAIRKM